MTLSVTPIYVALLALLFIVLCFQVIGIRRNKQISMGDGDDPALRARIRVQANFVEYAPFGLLSMLIVELQGGGPVVLHLVGLSLFVGRAAHAYGVSRHPQIMPLRFWGMILTFSSILIGALANLFLVLI